MTEILLVALMCLVELQEDAAEGKTVEEIRSKTKAYFSEDQMKVNLRFAGKNINS